jgi:hypothetical protein
VRDEHDGRRGLGADADQLVLHPLPGHLVERPERLVHQQQARTFGQGPRDGHPLLHASRELVGIGAGELLQPDQLDQLPGAFAPLGLAGPVQLQRELDVAGDGPPRQQPGLLEGDPVVLVEPGLAGALAEDGELTGGGRVQVRDQPQQGALPAAARADQGDELPGRDVEVDTLQGRHRRALTTGEDPVQPAHPDRCLAGHAGTSERR